MEYYTEMTIDEFVRLKKVKLKDIEHKKVVEIFYRYLQSVSKDERLLPSIVEKILGINLTNVVVLTGCFNGANDGTIPPYDNVDFYIKLSNDIRVYIYGRKLNESAKLNENEYVVFVIADEIQDNILRKNNHHIYLL